MFLKNVILPFTPIRLDSARSAVPILIVNERTVTAKRNINISDVDCASTLRNGDNSISIGSKDHIFDEISVLDGYLHSNVKTTDFAFIYKYSRTKQCCLPITVKSGDSLGI